MAEFADGLVQGDAAKKIYVARSKSVDEKTVTAANENALTTKVQGEEQDGWSVAKKNSKSVRVSKPKPHDRQLEDDVWCLLQTSFRLIYCGIESILRLYSPLTGTM